MPLSWRGGGEGINVYNVLFETIEKRITCFICGFLYANEIFSVTKLLFGASGRRGTRLMIKAKIFFRIKRRETNPEPRERFNMEVQDAKSQ